MEAVLLVIGKTSSSFIAEGIAQYMSRLRHYLPMTINILPDIRKKMASDEQKEAEGDAILKTVTPADLLILLDERGREMTSEEYSQYLNRQLGSGRKRIIFVIGGPFGFSSKVYDRADGKISMSRMTFTHEMVRLFFVEQTYRAMTILRGESYHHR